MPNDPGPTSWDPQEYQRALAFIEQAGTGDAARLARARTMVRVDQRGQPTVRVPEWSDVVRVGPRTIVTPEDRAIQRHFERAKIPSPLAPEVQDEIKRRRELAQHIRDSEVPEYQQGVAAAATAVDNINDAAVTASVAARVAIPWTGRLGAFLAPASAALGAIATFLGWIAAGIYAFGIAYALACQGPRAAAAQASGAALATGIFKGLRLVLPRRRGIPHPTPGQSRKGRLEAMVTRTPDGRLVTGRGSSRWARSRISLAEGLQIAQTAYDITGYGVSLGAVYGFTAETTYTATRAGKGHDVTPRSPRVNHELERILRPHVETLSGAALWHREQCCRALGAAPLILRDPETYGPELYALTWLTYYVSLEPLMWDTQGVSFRESIISALPAEWYAWDVRDPTTRDALELAGIDPDAPRPWPLPGSPLTLSSDVLTTTIALEIGAGLRRFLEARPFEPLARFVAELSVHVCERVWYFLEASNEYPTWELSPTAAVWASIVQADRWPIISDPPDRLLLAWQRSEDYVRQTGRKVIDVPVLDHIWDDAGTPLLRIVGDSSSDLTGFLVPYDQESGQPRETAFGRDLPEARARLRELLERERQDDAGAASPP